MREAMRRINERRGSEDLALNIGVHEGPCLAVVLDDRQDYFGQTVNIAARVQDLAEPSAVLATKPVVESAGVTQLVADLGYRMTSKHLSLRGVSKAFEVFEICERESYVAQRVRVRTGPRSLRSSDGRGRCPDRSRRRIRSRSIRTSGCTRLSKRAAP